MEKVLNRDSDSPSSKPTINESKDKETTLPLSIPMSYHNNMNYSLSWWTRQHLNFPPQNLHFKRKV